MLIIQPSQSFKMDLFERGFYLGNMAHVSIVAQISACAYSVANTFCQMLLCECKDCDTTAQLPEVLVLHFHRTPQS